MNAIVFHLLLYPPASSTSYSAFTEKEDSEQINTTSLLIVWNTGVPHPRLTLINRDSGYMNCFELVSIRS